MALSKLLHPHLKSLIPSPNLAALRLLSFATPADATAERRRRKARLGMDPPLADLRHLQPPPPRNQRPPYTFQNPSIPKLPEPPSALSGSRLVLHNNILSLLNKDTDADLIEADLLVRHSIYSYCRPTIFTCNAVLSEHLRRSRPADLLALHRFVIQAGIAPNVATYNLALQAYCDRGALDTALENYRVFLRNSPLTPSPTTYRILVKALAAQPHPRLDDALLLKDDMTAKAFCPPDPTVYHLLMSGFVADGDPDRALALYDELKEKLGGGPVEDGIVYGSLMKAYFKKGMEKEAFNVHHEVLALAQGSKIRFNEASYNSMLEALCVNCKFDDALLLLDRMIGVNRPPQRLAVNLESFKIMVDEYCAHGRMRDAIFVFGKIGESKCVPDTASYNNLMEHLGKNQMAAEADELYMEMGERGINPDESTHVILMEACFGVGRVDDAAGYFNKMIEMGLKPNTIAYNKAIGGLVNVGRLDEAKGFFDMMVDKQVKPDLSSYEMLLRSFCEAGRLDDALKICRGILTDEGVVLRAEMKELMNAALKKEMRENDLLKLCADVEREKAEAIEKARLAMEEAARKEKEAMSSIGIINLHKEISDGVSSAFTGVDYSRTMKKLQMIAAPTTKLRLEDMLQQIGKP